MALATFRHNETGELLELSEDWLTRYPKDPYTLVGTDDLAKLETERRQAEAAALGAKPFDQGEDTPTAEAPAPAPAAKATDADAAAAPATYPHDARRF